MYENLPFIFIVSTGTIVITIFGVNYIIRAKDKLKYGNIEKDVIFANRIDAIGNCITKSCFLNKLLIDLSLKFSVFNSKSFIVNMRYSILSFALFILLSIIVLVVLLVIFFPVWYMALAYMFLFASLLCLLVIFASSFANNRFLRHMPETLRILCARYACINNISKCIGVSISDFHKSMRGDMVRIYDALKQNDMERIKNTFSQIDVKYSNEHMSLLLELIWHAYYNGGDDVIKGQFNDMLEDIIEDIENKRDLSAASISYIGMGALFGTAVPFTKVFNENMLGLESSAFYASREGIMLSFLYYLFLVGVAFLIIVIERS